MNAAENLLPKPIHYFQKFHAHITIAYRDLEPNFKPAWEYFQNQELEMNFLCDQITILKHNGEFWQPLNFVQLNS